MRIAFLSTISDYPWGGADTLWTAAAEHAAAGGDALLLSITPAVAAHPRIAALLAQGARLLERRPPGTSRSLGARVLRKLGLVCTADATLIADLRSFRPDLVVFSQGGTYDLLLHRELVAWLRAAHLPYRVIANWQEEAPHLEAGDLAFARAALGAADRVFFVSQRNLTTTRRHLDLPLPQAEVIHNPLRWQPADVSSWPSAPACRLATVSRLDPGKGIALLLEALAAAGSALPPWELNIHGRGPAEAALREQAKREGLDARVHFRGYVSELLVIWAENHLMISPALEEGVPMTIPEAMLCQRPVLATRVGGAEDWIEDGRTGFLCPERNAAALAASLQHALGQAAYWREMGGVAATSALAHYRPNDYIRVITP